MKHIKSFEDIMLFMTNGLLPLKIVKLIWLHWFAYRLCWRVVFPSYKIFVEEILPSLVLKTIINHLHPTLNKCLLVSCTFNFWMLKGVHDMFTIVDNFLSIKKEPKSNATIRLWYATSNSTFGCSHINKSHNKCNVFLLFHVLKS
jgi:hypothetical protein